MSVRTKAMEGVKVVIRHYVVGPREIDFVVGVVLEQVRAGACEQVLEGFGWTALRTCRAVDGERHDNGYGEARYPGPRLRQTERFLERTLNGHGAEHTNCPLKRHEILTKFW